MKAEQVIKREQPNMWRGLGLGIVSGLAFLCRPDALGLCLLFLVYMAWYFRGEWHVWLTVGASVLGLVLMLTPWVIRNAVIFHSFVLLPNHGGFQLWEQNWLRYQRANSEEWQNMPFPERRAIPDFEALDEVTRDRMLGRMASDFPPSIPPHAGGRGGLTYAKYALSRLHKSYPLIPREELPPPIGWRGQDVQPDGASYSSTSLDDVPQYVTFSEAACMGFPSRILVGSLWNSADATLPTGGSNSFTLAYRLQHFCCGSGQRTGTLSPAN
jgi:hypothetical protein